MKPWLVFLNRGRQSQCVLGPSRIYYDVGQGDEFKVLVPHGYLNRNTNQCPLADSLPTIEVYTVPCQDKSFKYANENLMDVSFNSGSPG